MPGQPGSGLPTDNPLAPAYFFHSKQEEGQSKGQVNQPKAFSGGLGRVLFPGFSGGCQHEQSRQKESRRCKHFKQPIFQIERCKEGGIGVLEVQAEHYEQAGHRRGSQPSGRPDLAWLVAVQRILKENLVTPGAIAGMSESPQDDSNREAGTAGFSG